jgi:uncharacterized protein (DUF779 family)
VSADQLQHHEAGSFLDMETPLQVIATEAALRLIQELKAAHGPLMFYQSGGCCEGSAPMCFPLGEFRIGSRDVQLGDIGGAPFYISAPQFEYWKHTQLIIDVVPGFGAAFSLEGPGGLQFLTRSHVFTPEEVAALRFAGRL